MRSRSFTVIVHSPQLTDTELNAALDFAEDSPQWKAIMQIFETWKKDTIENAVSCLAANGNTSMDVAAYDTIDQIQKEFIERRSK